MVQFVAWSSLVAGKRYTDRAGGRASGGGWREPVVHPFGRFRRVSPPHPRPARPRATYYGASAIIPRFRFRSMNGNASPRLASPRVALAFASRERKRPPASEIGTRAMWGEPGRPTPPPVLVLVPLVVLYALDANTAWSLKHAQRFGLAKLESVWRRF